MFKQTLKRFVLILLAVLMPINTFAIPFSEAISRIQAETSVYDADTDSDDALIDPTEFSSDNSSSYSGVANIIQDAASSDTLKQDLLGLDNPRLIFSRQDMDVLQQFKCLSKIMPDFDNDIEKVFNLIPLQLPAGLTRPKDQAELLRTKREQPATYARFIDLAKTTWGGSTDAKTLLDKELASIAELKKKKANPDYNIGASTSYSTLSCLTGMTVDQMIDQKDDSYLPTVAYDSLNSTVLDVRILKTLVYLVTPKDQGGAGHWRIRVRKITQIGKTYSSESEAIRTSLANGSGSTSTADCADLTAEECGRKQRQAAEDTSATEDSNITVEDENGDEYYARLDNIDDAAENSTTPERNRSAHVDGQAVDISEVDDIRCTLIQKKRIGGEKTEKKTIRPIKLAWQTAEGYAESGGNSTDLMAVMKGVAKESIQELILNMGGDVTDYNDDLSKANFNDVVGIIGKTLFAEVINSPEHNLSGFNTADTIKKLGAMYFADLLGLPREAFLNNQFSSIDDIERLIGQYALEDKLGLAPGSLSSLNPVESKKSYKDDNGVIAVDKNKKEKHKAVNDLEGLLMNIGLKKLEFEMNLDSGSLNDYIKDQSADDADYLIGQKVIEKDLNIAPGLIADKDSIGDLRKSVGDMKSKLFFDDPTFLDTALHLTPGTGKKLKQGQMSVHEFVVQVGQTRKNDTLNGLNYIAANNSAYNIGDNKTEVVKADGTKTVETSWDRAIRGQKDGFVEIGLHYLSRAFAESRTFSSKLAAEKKFTANGQQIITDDDIAAIDKGELTIETSPADLGQAAFEAWIKSNLLKVGSEQCVSPGIEKKVVNGKEVLTTKAVEQDIEGVKITKNFSDGRKEVIQNVTIAQIDISEQPALKNGLRKNDIYRMFGCASSRTNVVLEEIGSKMLYYALANYLINDEEKINVEITDMNPELRIANPAVAFYTDRLKGIKELANKISTDWKGYETDDTTLEEASEHIDNILSTLADINVLNIPDATKKAAAISHEVDALKINFEQLKLQQSIAVDKINGTIIDLNELIRLVSEIFEGRELMSSELLKLKELKKTSDALNNNSNGYGENKGGNGNGKISPTLILDLLAHNIDATMFFVRIGASKAEGELNLPANSLLYLVQNYEKYGLSGTEAFYAAIGQAKIEEEFNMPMFYFQSDDIGKEMPNFEDDKNIDLLVKYANQATIKDAKTKLIALGYGSEALAINSQVISTLKQLRYVSPVIGTYYENIILLAKAGYSKEYASRMGHSMIDRSLTDITYNVEKRGYSDGIRDANSDIAFRMGIAGSVTALKNRFTQSAESRGKSIDQQLNIASGSTKSLFTETQVRYKDAKDIVGDDGYNKLIAPALTKEGEGTDNNENGLIPGEALSVYLKLINGDTSLNEISGQGLGADYIESNPYLEKPKDTADNCPISFEVTDADKPLAGGSFYVNEQRLEEDSYCIYDSKGYHCFQSRTEAQRFSAEHKGDAFKDILDIMAARLASPNMPKDTKNGLTDSAKIKDRLTQFIEGTIDAVFSDEFYAALADLNLKSTQNQKTENGYIANFPVDEMKAIFTKKSIEYPVRDYKIAVGKAEAKKALSWKLFSSLGLKISPDEFGPDDFYDILNGNMQPLYKIGAAYLDDALNLKQGTVRLIITAANPDNLKCAIAEAGANMLGSYFGLDSVPIRIDKGTDVVSGLKQNIGQSIVENKLGLPKGTFYGQSINEIITRIKPLNFAKIFRIPLTISRLESGEVIDSLDQSRRVDLAALVGAREAESLKGATGQYKLDYVLNFLSTSPGLTTSQKEALGKIDSYVNEAINHFLEQYGKGELKNDSAEDQSDYDYEVSNFQNFVSGLDSQFGLPANTTSDMFKPVAMAGHITPNQYLQKIGNATVVDKLTSKALGEIFNLDDDQAEAAKDILVNFKKFFSCSSLGIGPGQCNDDYYQNYGLLYDNLTTIFKVDLDNKAGLAPGSFDRMFKNPARAHLVLMDNAATKLDEQLKLDANDIFSFGALYSRYASWSDDNYETNQQYDQACRAQSEADYGATFNNLQIQKHNLSEQIGDLKSENKDTAELESELKKVNNDIGAINDSVQDCIEAKRDTAKYTVNGSDGEKREFKVTDEALDIINDGIARKIKDKISAVKVNGTEVGVDMPLGDIKELVFRGDLRYLQIVAMTLTVNYIQAKSDEGKDEPVPSELRLNYDDIKLAFFPDESATVNAENVAAWITENNGNPVADDSAATASYGKTCPIAGGDVISSLFDCGENVDNPTSLIGMNTESIQQAYSYAPTEAMPAIDGQQYIAGLEQSENDLFGSYTDNYFAGMSQGCIAADGAYSNEGACKEWNLQQTQIETQLIEVENKKATYESVKQDAVSKSKQYFKENLEFKLLDQTLWGADHNVFPGFSRALIKGDGKVKSAAIAAYLKNGLKNGNIMGAQFKPFEAVAEWLPVFKFMNSYFATNDDAGKKAAFDEFATGDGLNVFANYFSDHTEDWFGFKLDTEMTKGLLVGAFTGSWGSLSPMSEDSFYKAGNTQIKTFGSAVKNWGLGRLFNWADKALGMDMGTSYKVFEMAKDVYNTGKAYAEIRKLKDFSNLTADQAKYIKGANKLADDVDLSKLSAEDQAKYLKNTKVAKKTQVQQLKVQLATFIITYFFDKWAGGEMARIEERLNLVPGSLSIVMDAAIGVGVSSVAVNTFGMNSSILSNAATGFYYALAMFVIMNLFGVYKVELKCTADGYWPEMEVPDSTLMDVSGLGEWNGLNNNEMQEMSIKAAQYKARRLIIDVLSIQDAGELYKDVVPSQTLTGRQEDVDFANNLINSNLCSRLGLQSVNGVCGGDTRAGAWKNPQTVAWTHIGF